MCHLIFNIDVGTYFATSMAMVGVSCFHSVIVLNVFYRGAGGRQVPRWAKVYVVGYLGRLLRLKGSSNKIEKYGDVNQRRDQVSIH